VHGSSLNDLNRLCSVGEMTPYPYFGCPAEPKVRVPRLMIRVAQCTWPCFDVDPWFFTIYQPSRVAKQQRMQWPKLVVADFKPDIHQLERFEMQLRSRKATKEVKNPPTSSISYI
jgi:hypothetical protein